MASLIRKHRLPVTSFVIRGDATPRDEHPKIFTRIDLVFAFEGEGVEAAKLNEAVQLSLTKYCGVSAMVAPTSPIFYRIELNGAEINSGEARFA